MRGTLQRRPGDNVKYRTIKLLTSHFGGLGVALSPDNPHVSPRVLLRPYVLPVLGFEPSFSPSWWASVGFEAEQGDPRVPRLRLLPSGGSDRVCRSTHGSHNAV